MISEGIEIENTHQISKLCIKPDLYEIIKIKSGFPDDTQIPDFRHCPSWKAVCITIMKNDWGLTYMSCSRSVDKNLLKTKGLEKYKKLENLKNAKLQVAGI